MLIVREMEAANEAMQDLRIGNEPRGPGNLD